MAHDTVSKEALLDRINLLERKLDVLERIDEICDTQRTPSSMIASMTDFLIDFFESELCLFCIDEGGKLIIKTIIDSANQYQQYSNRLLDYLESSTSQYEDNSQTHIIEDLYILSTGIFMTQNNRLGAILLSRKNKKYNNNNDRLILNRAESRIDTGIVQCQDYQELEIRNKILKALRDFDSLRDKHLPLDETISQAINLQLSFIPAEIGVITLFNPDGKDLEMKGTSSNNAELVGRKYDIIKSFCLKTLDQHNVLVENQFNDELLKSIIGLPLVLENHKIGVLCCINSTRPKAFTDNDMRLLEAIGSQMDTTIFESMQTTKIKTLLSRTIDPKVMKKLLDNPKNGLLLPEKRKITILYIDLRDSTKLANNIDPVILVNFINEYFEVITKVVFEFAGTLNNFVGDEVVAFWNAPLDQPNHTLQSVKAAIKMQEDYSVLINKWKSKGISNLAGIGISTGFLTVGEMGYSERTIYTVIGDDANRGARFCSKAPGGTILIDRTTLDGCNGKIEAEPFLCPNLKGLENNIEVFIVKGIINE